MPSRAPAQARRAPSAPRGRQHRAPAHRRSRPASRRVVVVTLLLTAFGRAAPQRRRRRAAGAGQPAAAGRAAAAAGRRACTARCAPAAGRPEPRHGDRLPRAPATARSRSSRSARRRTRACSRGSSTGSSAAAASGLACYQLGGGTGPATRRSTSAPRRAPTSTRRSTAPSSGSRDYVLDGQTLRLADRHPAVERARRSSSRSRTCAPDPALTVGSTVAAGELEGRHGDRPLAASSGRRSPGTRRTRATTSRSRCTPPRRSLARTGSLRILFVADVVRRARAGARSRSACPGCARSSASTSASSTARTPPTASGSRRSSPTGCSPPAPT